MAGHNPGILMTGHIPHLALLKRGCANSVVGLELAETVTEHGNQ